MDLLRLRDGHRVSVRSAAVLSGVLVAAGNGVVVVGRSIDERTWVTLLGVPAIAAVGVVWLSLCGSSRSDLGLVLPRTVVAPLPRFLLLLAAGVSVGRIAISLAAVDAGVLHEMVRLVVGTALGEEVVHRGMMLALWCRTGVGPRVVVLACTVSFVLWHVAVAAKPGGFEWLDLVGPAIGTPVLLWIRLRTGSVLASAAFHLTPNSFGLPR